MPTAASPTEIADLRAELEAAFDARATLDGGAVEVLRPKVERAMQLLESGQARVAEPGDGGWVVNQWLKKAVLLYFRCNDMRVMESGAPGPFWDKVPTRFEGFSRPCTFPANSAAVAIGASETVPQPRQTRWMWVAWSARW